MMLVEVNVYGRHVYVEDFENEFLRTTQLFYKQESQEFLANNTVQDYLKKVSFSLSVYQPVFRQKFRARSKSVS